MGSLRGRHVINSRDISQGIPDKIETRAGENLCDGMAARYWCGKGEASHRPRFIARVILRRALFIIITLSFPDHNKCSALSSWKLVWKNTSTKLNDEGGRLSNLLRRALASIGNEMKEAENLAASSRMLCLALIDGGVMCGSGNRVTAPRRLRKL